MKAEKCADRIEISRQAEAEASALGKIHRNLVQGNPGNFAKIIKSKGQFDIL
jgi:hypothetical protein